MKKAIDKIYGHNHDRVAGVDASTRCVAIAIIDAGRPVCLSRVDLGHGDMISRLSLVRDRFIATMKLYKPTFCMIEAPIMVQNPQTTKHMAYVVGILMGACLELGISVDDVPPMTWKTSLGYKPLKRSVINDLGLSENEAKRYVRTYNKDQIRNKMIAMFPSFSTALEDDDLSDALGIALYAWDNYGRR